MFNKVYVTVNDKHFTDEERKIIEEYFEKEIPLIPFTLRKKNYLSIHLTEVNSKIWLNGDWKEGDGDEEPAIFKVNNIYHNLSDKSSIIILTYK